MTIRSGAIAWRLSAVSIRLSPLESDELDDEKFRLSAESRFSAISKLEQIAPGYERLAQLKSDLAAAKSGAPAGS